MDPKTQNQNNKQSFDFILDQHGPEPPKKGVNKKILVIIILLVVTLVGVGLLMLTASSNVQQDGQTATTTEVNEQAAQDVINTFYKAAAAGDAKAVRATFVSDLPYDEAYFNSTVIPFLKKIEVTKCEPVENRQGVGLVDDRGFVIRTYRCPVVNSDNDIGMEFILKNDDSGSFQIFYYNLVALDETDA